MRNSSAPLPNLCISPSPELREKANQSWARVIFLFRPVTASCRFIDASPQSFFAFFHASLSFHGTSHIFSVAYNIILLILPRQKCSAVKPVSKTTLLVVNLHPLRLPVNFHPSSWRTISPILIGNLHPSWRSSSPSPSPSSTASCVSRVRGDSGGETADERQETD